MGSGRKKKVTVGWRYGLTVHMGVCSAPVDQIEKILADDREAHSTPISATQTISIDKTDLFGGDEKEGGLRGQMHVQMGAPDQMPSPFLTAQLGVNIPAFRGVLGFIYKGIMSANNPYLKPFSFIIQRVLKGWRSNVWYPEKAVIQHLTTKRTQNDMNPAHIIYQCLTDTDWGMGYPTSFIDDANFRVVANQLYSEGFGLSLMWNQQSTIEAFLGIIFNHIAGSLNVDPKTGKYQIRLIRQDYDRDRLAIFDESNVVELLSYQRAGWGELVNEITVKYTDVDTFEETAITVQNLATIQAQASVVNQTMSFTGITNASLASRVAQRELIARSSPLAKIQITINRNAWQSMPNGLFKFSWAKLGIASMVMRIVSVGTGTLKNGTITIDAIEDVFGLPDNSYVNQQDNEWENPLQAAKPSPYRLLTEVNYYDLASSLSPAEISYIDPEDGYPIMYASRPSVAAYDYKLLIDGQEVDQGAHCTVATITSALAKEEFSTFYIDVDNPVEVIVGEYAVIEKEYVYIQAFDMQTKMLSVARGVIDTVPVTHPANSMIFFGDGASTSDPNAAPQGAFLSAKVITRTGLGELDPSIAPIDTVIIHARHHKPYPPAKFRINNLYLPALVEGPIKISWNERNRLSQENHILTQRDASIAKENQTRYGIRIYDQNQVLRRTIRGLTGTSYQYPILEEIADCGGEQTHIGVEIYSEREGIESWQFQEHRFARNYGQYELQDFDFAVIRYIWGTEDGKDLDTRTSIQKPARQIMVGWAKNNTDDTYLQWGGDNTDSGVEAVLVDMQKLALDYPSEVQFELDLNMFWYGQPISGDFQIQFESYKGGSMSQNGFDFSNTDGISVQKLMINHSTLNRKHSEVEGAAYDGVTIATLGFDPVTKKGVLTRITA